MEYIISFQNIPSVVYVENSTYYINFLIDNRLLPDIEIDDDIIINSKKYKITETNKLDKDGYTVLKCIVEE